MSSREPSPDEIRRALKERVDIEALMSHEFEYYVWFRGHSHRLECRKPELIDVRIAEFIIESGAGVAGDQDRVYVFRDFELWLTLHVSKWSDPGLLAFQVINHWLQTSESLQIRFDH